MNERMKGFLGMLGKNLGITEAVNPQARMKTGEALPTGQDQFNIARERADIPSPRADFADKSRNEDWVNYKIKNDLIVKIIVADLDEEEAFIIERELIKIKNPILNIQSNY